jgi:hypothetical protein
MEIDLFINKVLDNHELVLKFQQFYVFFLKIMLFKNY